MILRASPAMRPETTARELTKRIDALADALRAAGVTQEGSERLLAAAASAAMHAVTLDALAESAHALPDQGPPPVDTLSLAA